MTPARSRGEGGVARVFREVMTAWRGMRAGMDGTSWTGLLGLAAGAVAIGYLTVMVSSMAPDKPAMLAVLPLMLLTGFLFVYSREAFLMVVLLPLSLSLMASFLSDLLASVPAPAPIRSSRRPAWPRSAAWAACSTRW